MMKASLAHGLPTAIGHSVAPLVTSAAAVVALLAFTHRAPASSATPTPTPSAASHGCEDPIGGVWVARTYRTEAGDYHEYALTVARSGAKLTGALDLRVWVPEESAATIPMCSSGEPADERTHIMATGTVIGNNVRIDAHAVTSRIASSCTTVGGYSPDHFVGVLDAKTDTLDMRNNDDGGNAHDRPYLFRRVACR